MLRGRSLGILAATLVHSAPRAGVGFYRKARDDTAY